MSDEAAPWRCKTRPRDATLAQDKQTDYVQSGPRRGVPSWLEFSCRLQGACPCAQAAGRPGRLAWAGRPGAMCGGGRGPGASGGALCCRQMLTWHSNRTGLNGGHREAGSGGGREEGTQRGDGEKGRGVATRDAPRRARPPAGGWGVLRGGRAACRGALRREVGARGAFRGPKARGSKMGRGGAAPGASGAASQAAPGRRQPGLHGGRGIKIGARAGVRGLGVRGRASEDRVVMWQGVGGCRGPGAAGSRAAARPKAVPPALQGRGSRVEPKRRVPKEPGPRRRRRGRGPALWRAQVARPRARGAGARRERAVGTAGYVGRGRNRTRPVRAVPGSAVRLSPRPRRRLVPDPPLPRQRPRRVAEGPRGAGAHRGGGGAGGRAGRRRCSGRWPGQGATEAAAPAEAAARRGAAAAAPRGAGRKAAAGGGRWRGCKSVGAGERRPPAGVAHRKWKARG
jgi:hypothetical protein